MFSLYLFLRTHKAVKTLPNQDERRREIHAFYHQSFGIFAIIFFTLLLVALAFIPSLENGGHFYLLYCLPMALLCMIPAIVSYKGMKSFKLENGKNLTKI
jgi:peptidoglycan/LPS O-acetylase OafA/YrhL